MEVNFEKVLRLYNELRSENPDIKLKDAAATIATRLGTSPDVIAGSLKSYWKRSLTVDSWVSAAERQATKAQRWAEFQAHLEKDILAHPYLQGRGTSTPTAATEMIIAKT